MLSKPETERLSGTSCDVNWHNGRNDSRPRGGMTWVQA